MSFITVKKLLCERMTPLNKEGFDFSKVCRAKDSHNYAEVRVELRHPEGSPLNILAFRVRVDSHFQSGATPEEALANAAEYMRAAGVASWARGLVEHKSWTIDEIETSWKTRPEDEK